MIRISVTDVDSFLRYKDEEIDMPLEEMLRRLRREQPRTTAMLGGTAFHTVLENIKPGVALDVVEQDGFKFHFKLDCEISIPPVRELKAELEMMTSAGPVTLVGKVDGIDTAVRDYKLTGRWDAEKYTDSYQWRCYLLMFGLKRFRYDVFVGDLDEAAKEYVINDYHALNLYAYPDMKADVEREVDELAQFIAKHLPESVKEAA